MNGRARVEIIEIDLSSRVPSFPGVYGAMVLNTSKGDVMKPRLITSEAELFRRMMSSETILPRDPLGLFEAKIFLQKSNSLWICRPDTGATYGGAYLAQDIPVHELAVSVNQGKSSFYLRTTTEEEADNSAFIYATLSDGDVIQFEGSSLPAPLRANTNYFAVKGEKEKYGIRVALSREAALAGEYVVFESAGAGVVIKFTPDDVNGEQQYPVRNPAGYELDTSDGKAAGFESTFMVDIEGDYLNVTKEFYKAVETGDAVTLSGEPEDIPEVDSGLPFDLDETYYLIKVPMEGVNADKYKVQLARTEALALSEECIGLNSPCGPSFKISLDTKAVTTTATLDDSTDLFEVGRKFYAAIGDNDVIRMKATRYPGIAGHANPYINWSNFNLAEGTTLIFNTTKTPQLNGLADSKVVNIIEVSNAGVSKYLGFWYNPEINEDLHFGTVELGDDGAIQNPVDFWNTTDGWVKTSYDIPEAWHNTGNMENTGFTDFGPNSFQLADISRAGESAISEETKLYAIRSPLANKIALSLEKSGDPIDWTDTGAGVEFVNTSKQTESTPSVDLSKDAISVSEMFYDITETGYEVTISSDGTLPGGLSEGRSYFVIKTNTDKTIKLASTVGNAEAGIPVDITDNGVLDALQNEYHHIKDKHNELYTGYKRRVGYLHTSSPTDEELYYKLYHYPYGKKEDWNDFDQSCADLVKEPGAFLVILYKKYDDQYLEVERKLVSRDEGHVDGYGQNIYVERVFESSNYVRWIDNKAVSTNVYPCNQTTYAKLTGGSLGHSATTGECIQAVRIFNNTRRYPVTLIMDAGWSVPAYQQAIIDVCEFRGATLGILSTPIEVEQSSNYLEDLIAYRRRQLITSTSHAALYSPHLKIYDEYNDREIYVSPTGHVGAQISYTAANYEPWFAPAGNRRGTLNVLGVTREFNDGDEDALYDAGINPIDFHEQYGIRIWGQKTLLSRASALDRVNVRMLLIVIEPAIQEVLEDFIFEFNDDFTRSLIVSKITPYLASIRERRGLYDFKVDCSESNNPPEVIDANELVVDIFIQPVKVAELIKGRIIITNTGASFSLS